MWGLNYDPATHSDDDLSKLIDSEVVAPCIAFTFKPGELRHSATSIVHDVDPSNRNVKVRLLIETTAGDAQSFWVWESQVSSLETVDAVRSHLLHQFEDWLPETALRWGQNVRLTGEDGTAQG